jgi:hypothetical protein
MARGVIRPLDRLLPAILAVVLATGTAWATQYHAMGIGLSSCGTWTADRSAQGIPALLDEAWVLGFLSGVGFEAFFDPLNGMDAEGVWAWVDNYCARNPISPIVDAAKALTYAHPH